MDRAARMELIRSRHRVLAGPNVYVSRGLEPKLRSEPKRHGEFPKFSVLGLYDWCQVKWARMPDAKQEPDMGHRNRQGISPLIKIAEQLPAKLPRVPLWP
jgi:hypothetical protein